MTAARMFRAVPLSDLGPAIEDAVVFADSDLDALHQAKQILGPETPFDLCEGNRFVLTHLPPRRIKLVAQIESKDT